MEGDLRGRLKGKKALSLFVTLGAITALGAGSLAVAKGDSSSDQHFNRVSNLGQPAGNLSEGELGMLADAGATAQAVRVLGTAGDFSLYVAPNASGASCFASAVAGTGIGGVGCPAAGTTFSFPSDSQPIFDMSISAIDPGTGSSTVGGLDGVAADGIAEVGIIGPDGALTTTTDVQGNVYGRRYSPAVDAKAIVALDARGREVYRKPLLSP
jgi:hypothetical protein